MNFNKDFYDKIRRTIKNYGSIGSLDIAPKTQNRYDENGRELVNSTNIQIEYTSKNIVKKGDIPFSTTKKVKRVSFVYDADTGIKAGDFFTDSNGDRYSVESCDIVGDTQGAFILYQMWCTIS